MKRRISFFLAVLMCFSLVFSALPAAMAAEGPGNEKITSRLYWGMYNYENDNVQLRVRIKLDAPSPQEVDAMIPAPERPTMDEYIAYRDALDKNREEVYSAINSAFVQNYLDETEEQVEQYKDMAYVLATVSKSRIAALAALEEVAQIELVITDERPPAHPPVFPPFEPGPDDPVYSDKIELRLQRQMYGTADDVLIPILVMLKSPTMAEIDATVPVPKDLTSDDQLEAYVSEIYRTRAKTYGDISANFVYDHLLRGTDRVYYACDNYPYVLAAMTKSRIAALAELDDILSIDQYDIPLYNNDEVLPHIPEAAPEEPAPDEQDNTEPTIIEAANAARSAYEGAVRTAQAAGLEIDADGYAHLPAELDDQADLGQLQALIESIKASKAAWDAAIQQAEALGVEIVYDEDYEPAPARPDEEHVHAYTDVVTAPTCTEAGYTTHTCACGDSYVDSEAAALGHDFQNGVCTRCRAEDPDYVPPAVDPFRFDDVKDDAQFYYAPVYWAVEQKITKGTSEKLFSPNDSCTRAQVVTFLWRAAGEPEPAETVNPFKDVDADAYYCKAVLWAVEKGVTKGTSADKFSPEKTCTRAQIVTFLYRANGTPEISRKSRPFTDVNAAQYYADAVAWAVENGITTGKSPETFAPNATCTRAEVVTFLYRAGNA